MELDVHREALLRNALAYAGRGWHVFPLRPGDKRPAFPDHDTERCTGTDPWCRDGHVGWEPRATVDPDRIRRAWTGGPAYNIGIACGPSGLLVVDLDKPKPGKETPPQWRIGGVADGFDVYAVVCERAGQPLPVDTYTVATGRGGTHLYYRHPADGPQLRNTNGEHGRGLGWLVDTRAHGGYVVAPGSVVAGRLYMALADVGPAPLPGWLAERLRPQPLPPQRPVVIRLDTSRRGRYLDTAITASLTAIRAAGGNDTLNTTLYGASVALGQLVAGGALGEHTVEELLVGAAVAEGHPPGGARRTVRSGFRAGARRPRTVAA